MEILILCSDLVLMEGKKSALFRRERSSHWQWLVEKAKFLVGSWVLVLSIFRGFSFDLIMERGGS